MDERYFLTKYKGKLNNFHLAKTQMEYIKYYTGLE